MKKNHKMLTRPPGMGIVKSYFFPFVKEEKKGLVKSGRPARLPGQKAKIVVFWAPFGLPGDPGSAVTGCLAPKILPHSGWDTSISCAWAL